MSTYEVSESAVALFDEQGIVIAWTRAAERLVGYCAREAVGRSAGFVLPSFGSSPTMSAFIEQSRARTGWSGVTSVRHRDGQVLDVSLRTSMLRGPDGTAWLLSMSDAGTLSGESMSGLVRGSLLTRAPIGVVIRDPQMRGVWVNDTMERHDGIPREQRLGHRLTDALPGAKAEAFEAVMRQVLANGASKVHEYRTWLPTSLGPEHPFAVSFSCLLGADGEALGGCTLSVDVIECQLARERLLTFSQAGARLGRTLDVKQTSQELADLAVPLFADFVAVDLEHSVLVGEGAPVRIGSVHDRLPVFRRVGMASVRQGIPESVWARGEHVDLPPISPFTEVFRTGKPYLEPILDTAPGTWTEQDSVLTQRIREHGMHSAMVVPIRVRQVLLGVALFVRTKDPVPFQKIDLMLAEELVGRAALSLDNARQYTRKQTAALALQRNLLPHRLRGGSAVEAVSRYQPAELDNGVGGDWFDVIPLSGARVGLVIGDVAGHGINAAATMGRLRTAVHTLADIGLPPGDLLARLDDTVQRLAEEDAEAPDHTPAVVGATCLYAVYDPVTRQCTMARAGHPPPAIVDPQGGVTFPDLPTGAPLGTGLGVPFETVELELPEGSLIALYTDGVIESREHDIDEGMQRLGAALAQPDRSLDDLCTRAMEPFEDQAARDDVTLLLVRTRSLSPDQVASWTLPGNQAAVRLARNLASRQLTTWGLECVEDATRLIVSELVTNAVRHSTGTIQLRLIQHESLTVEVTDTDTGTPRMRSARTVDENGRGLFLVSQLSHTWGSHPISGGKVVWAEQDLAPAVAEQPERVLLRAS
ncbi:SpoIIE family protein phosphatase [Streptomyces sp. NPDC002309]